MASTLPLTRRFGKICQSLLGIFSGSLTFDIHLACFANGLNVFFFCRFGIPL